MRRVATELGLSPAQFGVELIGNVESYGATSVDTLAREEQVADYVRLGPPRSRRDAMDFLARAAMLVILPQDSEMAIPAKVFEYIRFHAWVLGLATPASATAVALRGTGADVVAPGDTDAIAAVIRARYLQDRAAGRPRPIAETAPLSRARQADLLFDALERCVAAEARA